MNHFIKLIRPHQWIKNLFILIAPFFGGLFLNPDVIFECIMGITSFSLVSSAIYVLNDLKDVELDRIHPVKKYRPIPMGQVSQSAAILSLISFSFLGLSMGFWLDYAFGYIASGYFILNVAYCFGLKKVAIIDMVILAFGFVLRTLGGGFLADVSMSKWLLIIVFLLSFFLAIAKRRDDILVFMSSGVSVRKSSEKYNLDFINAAMTMLSTVLIVAYIMYTISDEVLERIGFEYLYFTAIFVISGVLRYLQLALVENNSSSPVKVIYTDRFIQITLFLWVLSFFLILYIY
ncbi:MAG: UbiA prenyltransferase family protein [Bacteroidota bacterium]